MSSNHEMIIEFGPICWDPDDEVGSDPNRYFEDYFSREFEDGLGTLCLRDDFHLENLEFFNSLLDKDNFPDYGMSSIPSFFCSQSFTLNTWKSNFDNPFLEKPSAEYQYTIIVKVRFANLVSMDTSTNDADAMVAEAINSLVFMVSEFPNGTDVSEFQRAHGVYALYPSTIHFQNYIYDVTQLSKN